MNRRTFGAFAAAALLLTLLAPAVSQAQLGPRLITGAWKVQAAGKEFHSGTMHLTQTQYTVVGYIKNMASGVTISISGKLNNNVMSGTWTNSSTGDHGWLTFTFAPTFTSFSGDYGRSGAKPLGNITGSWLKQKGHM